jgi:CubicO group peptidase (beta-lactamase class C family)
MFRACILVFLALASLACADNEPQSVDDYILAVERPLNGDGEELDSLTLPELMDEFNVPGVSLAIISDFAVHWAKSYGIADVESGAEVNTSTLFQAASISKPVVAMAVLKAVENGDFTLDTNINEILTSWRLPDSRFTAEQPVTPRSLTSHTSGLGEQILNGEAPSNVGPVLMERSPLVAMKYSGGGVTMMQLALEDATGKPIREIMQDYVLNPIEMSLSTFEQPLSKERDRNAARAHDENGEAMDAKWHVYPELAAAGLWTTPTDLAKFVVEVQKSVHGRANRVLLPSTIQEMLNPVGVGEFAVGFTLSKRGEGWYFDHGGSNWGFRGLLVGHKLKGYGLVVMTNADQGSLLIKEISKRVAKVYSWDTLDEPIAR